MGLAHEEQETIINFMRDDQYCTVYTTDTTIMTKLDRRVKNTKEWELIKTEYLQDGTLVSKTYKAPKRLISFRSSLTGRRLMTDEEKRRAGERLLVARQNKRKGFQIDE